MKHCGVAATLAVTMSLVLSGAPGASAATGEWQGPQTVDSGYDGALLAVMANASGAFALWSDGRFVVAHRPAGPQAAWSEPQPLAGSQSNFLEDGPVMALPSGASVVFATVAAAERTYAWRVSEDGSPGPRMLLPFDSFTPEVADRASDGRWLVAGTRQGVPAPAHMAVRSRSGSWRVSQRLPLARIEIAGAWFDRQGVPHIIVTSARPPGESRRPLSELRLRRDGSWSSPHQLGTVVGHGATAVANTDGDVTLAYSQPKKLSGLPTVVRTRPYGQIWSAPLTFRQDYPAIAIDEAGRTVIVRTGKEVFVGRINPAGSLVDGWQQLTDETFDNDYYGRQNLASGANGVAVVGVAGEATTTEGTNRIERYWRCLPGEECVEVGEFDLGPDGLTNNVASGPAGSVYAVYVTQPPCENNQELCSWRLPAPSATP